MKTPVFYGVMLCSWGGHIPEEWNLEQQCWENLHGDLYQILGNNLSV